MRPSKVKNVDKFQKGKNVWNRSSPLNDFKRLKVFRLGEEQPHIEVLKKKMKKNGGKVLKKKSW